MLDITLRRTLASVVFALLTLGAVALALMVAVALLQRFHVLGSSPEAMFQSSLWSVLLAVAAALAVFCYRSDTSERSVLFGTWRAAFRWYVSAVLAALSIAALSALLSRPSAVPGGYNPVLRHFEQAGRTAPAWILAVVYLVLFIPAVEELLFRRGIYSLLARFSPWIAFGVSVALFTGLHPREIQGPAFLIGMATAYLYQRTGSLLPSITCHGLSNAMAMIITMGRAG
jgi:membrane protease YdiL (CAAX protease family)